MTQTVEGLPWTWEAQPGEGLSFFELAAGPVGQAALLAYLNHRFPRLPAQGRRAPCLKGPVASHPPGKG